MPAEKPSRTGIPNIVELDLANSLDFHIATNNFISIATDFPEYIAVNYAWKIAQQSTDPIVAEAEFFKKLNKSEHKIDFAELGVQSISATNVNYDLIDLNSYLLEDEIWLRGTNKLPARLEDKGSDPTGEPRIFFKALNLRIDEERIVEYIPPLAVKYQTINSFLLEGERWVKDDEGFPKITTISEKKYYVAVNISTGVERNISIPRVSYTTLGNSIIQRISSLNTKYSTGFGAKEMSDEFLLNWYNKFKTAHHLVREEYKKLIGDDDTTDYFDKFNDSIGSLGRLFEYPDTTSVMTVDITFDLSRKDGRVTVPRTIPPSTFDKLSDGIKFLALDSSLTVNRLFRKNIVRAIEEVATPDQAHGTNLMTDHLHYHRMSLHTGDIASIVSDTIGASYRILAYVNSAVNSQNHASPKIHQIIEDKKIQIDMLQNKISTLTKNVSGRSILKAGSSDLPSQG